MVTAESLLREVQSRGVRVEVAGPDRLRAAPLSKLTPELIEALKDRKAEILRLVGESMADWPAECRDSEERHGAKHARLFPSVMRNLYDVTKAVRRALAGETDAEEALEIVLEVAKRLEADGHFEVATSVLGLAASFAECHSIDGHGAN